MILSRTKDIIQEYTGKYNFDREDTITFVQEGTASMKKSKTGNKFVFTCDSCKVLEDINLCLLAYHNCLFRPIKLNEFTFTYNEPTHTILEMLEAKNFIFEVSISKRLKLSFKLIDFTKCSLAGNSITCVHTN